MGAACLDQGEPRLLSATASSSPSVPLRKHSGHIKNQRGREEGCREERHTQPQICRYNSCSNKRVQGKRKKEKKKEKEIKSLYGGGREEKILKPLAFYLKLFKDFKLLLFLMADFHFRIVYPLSTIKSIKILQKYRHLSVIQEFSSRKHVTVTSDLP